MVDSEIYPTNIFYDPLLLPQWHNISNLNVIRILIDGNHLLKSFIKTLNAEIIEDMEIEDPDIKKLLKTILDYLRSYGWCAESNYNDGTRKALSPVLRTQWIKEQENKDSKFIRIGCEFIWGDDIGNQYTERAMFEDQSDPHSEVPTDILKSFLLKWNEPDGMIKNYMNQDTLFALGDIDLAILVSAISSQQIKSTMEITAVKPFFLFFKYGSAATTPQTANLKTQMGYVGPNAGIGAKGTVLDMIDKIENADIPNSILSLDKLTQMFANMTHLPLSFFLGERQNGGLGDTGESTDEIKIMNKKEEIMKKFISCIEELNNEELQITLNPNIYQEKRDEQEAKQEEMMKQSQDNQGDNDTDKKDKKGIFGKKDKKGKKDEQKN